jgi:hypothetical protein
MLTALLIVIAVLLAVIVSEIYITRKALIAASDLNLEAHRRTQDEIANGRR